MKNPIASVWNAVGSRATRYQMTVAGMIGGMYGNQSQAQRNLHRFWRYYASNEVVFAAVTETTGASSVIPFMVERQDGGQWLRTDASDPVQERLDNPNMDEDAIRFRERMDTELVVTGNAVIVEMPTARRGLGELRVLPTNHVYVNRDKKTGQITEYVYDPSKKHGGSNVTMLNKPSSDATVFPRNRVIHRIFAPDPDQMDWGISPLAAALDSIMADVSITTYIREFFKQGAVPPHIMVSETVMTREQERQLQRRWAENVGGVNNAWRLAILSGQKGEIKRLGLAAGSREIGLQDLRKSTEARILMAINVPPIVVGAQIGMEFASYSNYDQARQAMHEENTDPLTRKRDSAFTHYYRRRTGDTLLRIRGDMADVLAVQRRTMERSEQATRELQSGLIMQNEARGLVGYPPVDDGDQFYVPVNLLAQPGAIVTRDRSRRLAAALGDHAASATVIREQALVTSESLHASPPSDALVAHVMLEVARGDTETRDQFATRVLLRTHMLIAQNIRSATEKR